MRLRVILAGVLFLALAPSTGFAGSQTGAHIAMHVRTAATKGPVCPGDPLSQDPNSAGLPCSQYQTEQALFAPSYVYVVVAQAYPLPGIAGASFGILVDPDVVIFNWTLCADSELPAGGWPASGGGNAIAWDPVTNCQRTEIGGDLVHAVAGAFYTYAYGDGSIGTTRNETQSPSEFSLTDCSGETTEIGEPFAVVGFGSNTGSNPCLYTPHCYCDGVRVEWVTRCCYPDGSIVPCLSQAECEAQGGGWQTYPCGGPSPGDCEPPVPVHEATWGRLKSRHQ